MPLLLAIIICGVWAERGWSFWLTSLADWLDGRLESALPAPWVCFKCVLTLHPPASATQPRSFPSPLSSHPSLPPDSQSVSQERTSFSELPSLVATYLELRTAPRLHRDLSAAASYGCVDCVRQCTSRLVPRRKKKKILEKHLPFSTPFSFFLFLNLFFNSFILIFFVKWRFFFFLSSLQRRRLLLARSGAWALAVRTGIRRCCRTRTVQTQQDLFPLLIFWGGVDDLSPETDFNLEANVSSLFGIALVDGLDGSGLKLHPESLNNKVRTQHFVY